YPGTDRAEIVIRRALRAALGKHEGVSVVERDALSLAASRLQRLGFGQDAAAAAGLRGAPAHMQLRLLDAMDRRGTWVQLWCTDLLSGESWMLGEAEAASIKDPASAAALVAPVVKLVESCAPEAPAADNMLPVTQIV